MFGLQVLDVGLGLVFVYLFLSLTCTAATELIAGILKLRAKTLTQGIGNLLRDSDIQKKLFQHPLIKSLSVGEGKPSYIPSRTFALALANTLSGKEGSKLVEGIRGGIQKLRADSDLRKVMLIVLSDAKGDAKKLQDSIETWFNDSMDRVSGWYKRKSQAITFFVALLVAGGSNADTIEITKALSNDPALRQALVAVAQEYAKREELVVQSGQTDTSPSKRGVDSLRSSVANAKEAISDLKKLGIPIGWKSDSRDWDWTTKIPGLLLTTLAMTLGAPFWFDVLKKIVNIRSSGGLGAESKTGKWPDTKGPVK